VSERTAPTGHKGILLAGGRGTRLFPLTAVVNKHLLPVHDKPMIYYPLSTLMLGGVRQVLLVSSEAHLPQFQRLLGDGTRFGIELSYAAQDSPRGVADALLVAESFLDGAPSVLALGDNLLWGHLDYLREATRSRPGATAFAYPVQDASRYGVVVIDVAGRPTSIEEKPTRPRSQLAIPGLYVLDEDAVGIARSLSPSARGELEITDVLRAYLQRDRLRIAPLGRGMAWLDMGTSEGLLGASEFVATIQERQGLYVGCLEEVALRMGYLSPSAVSRVVREYPASAYRAYIESLLDA
jgi:glucose-1-phosphate thymidylyltransferase